MRLLAWRATAALLTTLVGPVGAALVPGDQPRTLDFGGLIREYAVHVPPAYDGTTDVPLVLNLHGYTSNGSQQRGISRMVPVSDANGFILAHPEGVANAWNAGTCCGNGDIDDVGFLRAVVAAISAEARIDARRIYVTGLSNGGAMSHRLACDAADLFAAAAPMAFPIPFDPLSGCQPSRAIPVMMVMGLTDTLVEYENGTFGSAPATFAYWRDLDGCGAGAPDERVDHGPSRCETYTECTAGGQVRLCSVVAQAFPGQFFDGHVLYLNPDFELAEEAWAFLSQFQLPEVTAPVQTALAGSSQLKVGNARGKQALAWTVALGDGTWTATDAGGNVYTGSARRRGRSRTFVLTPTTQARALLGAVLVDRLAEMTSSTGLEFTVDPRDTLRLVTNKAGTPVSLQGRLRLLRSGVANAVIGRFTVRARGAR